LENGKTFMLQPAFKIFNDNQILKFINNRGLKLFLIQSLKKAALESALLTGEQFDEWAELGLVC
jgi:hypothetical protein